MSLLMSCSKKPYTAKKKWLKAYKTMKINKILLVLRKSTRPPAENVAPKFFLDVTLTFKEP